MAKPWTTATTAECMAEAFAQTLCSHDHIHTPCTGGEVDEGSGNYLPEMARLISKAPEKETKKIVAIGQSERETTYRRIWTRCHQGEE